MKEFKPDERGKYELGDCIAMFIYNLYHHDPNYAEKKWIRPRPFLISEIKKYWWGHIHSTFLFKIWYRILLHGYPFYKGETCRGLKYLFNIEALALFVNEKVYKYYSFERNFINPIIQLCKTTKENIKNRLNMIKNNKE
jgi:hypothetical protein